MFSRRSRLKSKRIITRCALTVVAAALGSWIPDNAHAAVLSSKRGIGGGGSYDFLQATGAGWYYNWGTGAQNIGGFDADFYPMFWSPPSTGTLNSVLATQPKYILGFNEPEVSTQSNLTVSQAIAQWTTISNATNTYNTSNGTNIKLVSPAVSDTSAGQSWMSSFMSQANSAGLKVDAVAFHWYGVSNPNNPSGAASSFLSRVDSYHNSYNKPIFITEFAIHDWGGAYTDAQIIDANRQFLDIVIPALESRSYVAGYSWYNWFSDSPLYGGNPSLPNPMGYSYVGALAAGQSDNIGGRSLGEHVAYLNGGDLTATVGTGTVHYINALANTSTVSGTVDYGLNTATDWVRVQPGATINKTGTNTITFGAGSVTNNGTLMVSGGALRLGVNVTGTGSINIYSDGGATGSTGRLELTGGITVPGAITFAQRSDPGGSDGIRNVSGNNTLTGQITIAVGGAAARIRSDAGTLNLTGGITTSATTARNFYLQGAGNGVVTGAIVNNPGNSAGSINLFKEGAGTWTATAANAFTGNLTVSGGNLQLKNSNTMVNVTVATGATLEPIGAMNFSGAISISGTMDLTDSAINNINGTSTLSLASSTLKFEVGTSSADRIAATGAASVTGFNSVNFAVAPGQSVSPGTSYTLVSASSGLSILNFTLNPAKPASMGFMNLSLSTPTSTALVLSVSGNAIPTTAYWTGKGSSLSADASNNWGSGVGVNTTNWSTDAAGTVDPLQLPGSITSVILNATNATGVGGNLTTQLDSTYAVKGLTFDVAAASGITSATINTNAQTLAIGNTGLALAATSNASASISGAGVVALNGSQNWANNSSSKSLTVGAGITSLSGASTLTVNGTGTGGVTFSGVLANGAGTLSTVFNQSGTTVLSASNTYTGTTTVAGGTVEISSTGRLVSDTTINSGGTLRLTGGTDAIADSASVNILAGGTLDVRAASAGTAKTESIGTLTGSGTINRGNSGLTTLTLGVGNSSSSFAGAIQNGSGQIALVKTGTGTLTLSGTSNYTGGTTISDGGGNISITSAAALGTGAVTIGNGGANQTGTLQVSGNFTMTGANVPTINVSSRSTSDAGGDAQIENVSGNNTIAANININNTGGTSCNILSTSGSLILTGNLSSTGLTSARGFDFYGSGNGVVSGIISNGTTQATWVQKDGTGAWRLSGNNTYTGGTIINAGMLIMNSTTALGAASSTVDISTGGSLNVRTDGGDRAYNINVGSGNTIGLISDVNTGSVGINHTLGTLAIGGTTQVNVTSGFNVASGSPSITLGNVTLTSGVGAGDTTFNPTSASITLGAVTTSTNSAKGLILDGTSASNFINGVISDGSNVISVTKSNTSTWTLAGLSTYTGPTSTEGGTLIVTGKLQSTSAVTIGAAQGAAVLRASSTQALGTAPVSFDGAGNASTARMELTSGISLNNSIYLPQRNNNSVAIENISGNNTLSGAISIATGGTQARIQSDAGLLSLSGPISVNASVTSTRNLYLQGAGNGIVSGVMSDLNATANLSVAKEGAGTWTLASTNTYTGATIITAGTLQVGNGGTLGTLGTGAVTNNAQLTFSRSDTATVANVISGTGNVSITGVGAIVFTGANTYAGTTTISAGTLRIGNGGTSGSLGTGNVTANGTLAYNRSGSTIVNNLISGTGNFSNIGSGTTRLTGANTYAGTTSVTAGVLEIAGSHNGNHGAYNVNSAILRVTNTGVISASGTPGALTVTGTGQASIEGGNATFASVNATNLNIQSNGKLKIAALGSSPITTANTITTSLTITTGGQLDITNNAIRIASSDTTDTARNALWAKVASGQNNFDANGQVTWDGPGIVSSTARTSNVALSVDVYAVGVVSNHDYANLYGDPSAAYGPTNPWLGTVSNVGADDLLVRMTYSGDSNLDGTITIDDYNNIDGTYLGLNSTMGWLSGDFDYNGVITIDDYNAIDTAFLYQTGQLSQGLLNQRLEMFGSQYVAHLEQVAAAFASVPEPASVGLLGLSAIGLLARRRRGN